MPILKRVNSGNLTKTRLLPFAVGVMLLLIPSIAGLVIPNVHAFSNGQVPTLALGQQGLSGPSQLRADGPEGIAFDSSGNLWVADASNNRVLRFPAPFSSGEGANLVVGQANFVSNGAATSQSGLYYPTAVAFDASGNLWVVDADNHRVLRFSPPFTNGMTANLVVGQASFTTSNGKGTVTSSSLYFPWSVTFDSSGNLWVADCSNDRVLRYSAPFTTGMSASLVLGQAGFTTYAFAASQTALNCPDGLAFDSTGNLWVSDYGNNRILQFASPFSNGMNANLVVGQSDFISSSYVASQSGLDGPWFLAIDPQGGLWVGDSYNSRVLGFSAPFTNGMNAKVAIGQLSFTTRSSIGTSTWLNFPVGVAFDSSGNLWVSDNGNSAMLRFGLPFSNAMASNLVIGQGSGTLTSPSGLLLDPSGNIWASDNNNNRVLKFSPPYSSGISASLVLGQPDFTTNSLGASQNTLTSAFGLAMDSSGSLWVVDYYSNRILRFSPPFTNGMNANLVIGQASFASSASSTTQSGLNSPRFVALDGAGDLWVSDTGNNRVLMFAPPFSNGMGASLVLGQSGFTSSTASTTQNGLSAPEALAFDSSGNLWVADYDNNRTLMFSAPIASGKSANLVIGQQTFTSGQGSTSATGMRFPEGLAFDPRGNLWVSDQGNNRVLRFSPSFSTGMSATLVIGKSVFTDGTPTSGLSGFDSPRAITFDSAGNLWVSDRYNNRVLKYLCGSECPAAALSFGFSVQGGGSVTPPTLTYMSGGVPTTATLTSSATSYSIDYGSAWSVSGTLGGSTTSERWATNQPTTGTATTAQAISLSYFHQYDVKFGYNVTGGGTGFGLPVVTYSQFGAPASSAAGATAWVDSGSSYSYQNPLKGSTSAERWFSTSGAGTLTSASPVSVTFYHQYSFTATYTVSGGGSPTAPSLASTSLGSPSATLLSAGGQAVWLDAGASFTLTNPLIGSTANERWYTSHATGTVSGAVANVGYFHQYAATASYSIIGGGTPSAPILNATSTGVATAVPLSTSSSTVWLDAGSSYSLLNPLSSSSAGERWQATAGTQGLVSSPITIGPQYYHQYSIGLSFSVIGGGAPAGPSLGYTSFGASSSLGATASQQTAWADAGTQYSATNPLGGSTSSERWLSPSASGSVSGSATVSLQYHHQFAVTFAVTDSTGKNNLVPTNFTISLQGGGSQSVQGLTSWLDNGASFTISRLTWAGTDVKPSGQYSVSGPASVSVKALVYEATIKVSDILGLPVSGANVKMTLANGSVISGTTGGDGTFVASAIPLGTYTATVSGIGSSGQVTGDASKQSVATSSVLFGTTSLGVVAAIVIVVIGLAVFMLRRRSGGGTPKQAKASQTAALKCPKCGSMVDPSEQFCPNCGTKVR